MTVVGVVVIVVVDVINLVDVVVVDTIGLLLLLLWISAKEKLKLHFLNFDFTTFFHYFTGLNPDVRLRPVCVVSEGGCVKRPPRPQIGESESARPRTRKDRLLNEQTQAQAELLG